MDKDKLKEIHNKRFLDKNFQEVKFENQNNLQFFLSKEERNGKSWVVGKCFTNKSFNHRWFYRFKDEDGFNKQCLKTIDDNNSWKAKNEEYKQEQQKPHTLKVGHFAEVGHFAGKRPAHLTRPADLKLRLLEVRTETPQNSTCNVIFFETGGFKIENGGFFPQRPLF